MSGQRALVLLVALCLVLSVLGAEHNRLLRRRVSSTKANTPAKAPAKAAATKPPAAKAAATKPPAGKAVCLFVHGAGVNSNYQITDSFNEYWGAIQDEVGAYCTPKFIKYETHSRGWDNSAALTDVCNSLVTTQPTVVFTHSMGNLFYAALRVKAAQFCPKGASVLTSAKWVSLQGPFKGSQLADLCDKCCSSNNVPPFPTILLNILQSSIACNCQNGSPSGSTKTLSTTYKSSTGLTWNDLSAEAVKADFMLCGNAIQTSTVVGLPIALGLSAVVGLAQLAQSLGADAETSDKSPISGMDGLVPFHSCVGNNDGNSYQFNPKTKRYVGHMDHATGTFRNGDNPTDLTRMPIAFALNALKTFFPNVNGPSTAKPGIVQRVENDIKAIPGDIKKAATTVVNDVKSGATTVVNDVKNGAKSLINGVSNLIHH